MTEKYKIYIPEDMKSRLIYDAELFEFTKKDGSVNLNAFLKELIINYFDQYRETKDHLLNTILTDLRTFSSLSKDDAEAISDKIINTYMKNIEYKKERNTAITLTVSGRSYDIMRSIENNMLSNISLSQYMNELFSSYLSVPRNDREAIIFSETFEKLDDAIVNNRIVTFSASTAKGKTFCVHPYILAASKEEQCNYLLCVDNNFGNPRTFRVSRLSALHITSDCFTPIESMMEELKDAAIRNPQSASKKVHAKVKLTDKGVEKFKVITKNRPDISKKDGNTYYFDWPKMQLEAYFQRFGKDAIILSPKECNESMRIYYEKALQAYQR